MNTFWKVIVILCFAPVLYGQRDLIIHKPCYNDEISAYSGIKFGNDLLLTVHDLPSPDSIPDKNTRSKFVFLTDSCEVIDAQLFHEERQRYVSLNIPSNSGPVATNKDQSLLFVCNTDIGWNGNLGIYVLQRRGDAWSIQQEHPFNSPDYSIMHPSYDDERKRLYFSSNRESESFNLYYIDFDGTSFGEDIYALDFLNSPTANDVFPYVFENKLFYSSDRENGQTLDIYEGNIKREDTRKVIERPFNSNFDDFGYVMISNRTGFFTTNRFSGGRKDERFAFRKPLNCDRLPNFSSQKLTSVEQESLERSLLVIAEFKNIYGEENELTYKLNLEYLQEKLERAERQMEQFYCNLFQKLDTISLNSLDLSVKQSLESEALLDSLFNMVLNDIENEILIDSLLSIIQQRYSEIGIDLELEEQRKVLKEKFEPIKATAKDITELSDTLRKIVEDELKGLKIKEDDLPDFAKTPKGLFFAVQIGAFKNKMSPRDFANLSEVIEVPGPTELFHYIAGFHNNLDDALRSRAQIKGVGYEGAFIVAYCDGERIPIFRAKELLASGECVPIKQNISPQIDYTVVVKRPGTEQPMDKEIDPSYNVAAGAVKAVASELKKGLFFTVQIGVYNRPARSNEIGDMPDLITTLLPNGQIRYSSGMFKSRAAASNRIPMARERGFSDAFVTAYYKGERIPLEKAEELLREKGEGILE
jgi:hypothetical protein